MPPTTFLPQRFASYYSKFVALAIFIFITSDSFSQTTNSDSILVKNYDSRDGASGAIIDFFLDNSNALWVARPYKTPIKFDGKNFRKYDTVVNKEVSIMEMLSINQHIDGPITIYFKGLPRSMALNKYGKFEYTPGIPETNFTSRYPFYFNRKQFINSASNEHIRKDRFILLQKLKTDNSFKLLDDSTFFYKKNENVWLYFKSREWLMNSKINLIEKTIKHQNDLLLIDKSNLCSLDPESNSIRKVLLVGDILKYPKWAKEKKHVLAQNVEIFPGKFPHLMIHNRLYRLSRLSSNHYSTSFVCDLSFLRNRIYKVAYYPEIDLTIAGSLTEGLFTIRKNHFFPTEFPKEFKTIKSQKIYYPICTDKNDRFLTVWGSFAANNNYFSATSIKGDIPFGQFIDSNGKIWLTNNKGPIRCFDAKFKELAKFPVTKPSIVSVDFCEDENSSLYCLGNKSLMMFENNQFKTIAQLDSTISPSIGPNFQNISYLSSGLFFLGSENGLYIYNKKNKTITKSKITENAHIVNNLILDDSTALFTLYSTNKLVLFYQNKFFGIPLAPLTGITQIENAHADSKGRIWLGTTNGLYVTAISELKLFCERKLQDVFFYQYDKSDGLPITEFTGGLNPSSASTSDGWLAFNSLAGPIIFHEDSVKQIFPAPNFAIIRNGDKDVHIPPADTLQISSEKEFVRLEFIVSYFGNRRNLNLEYQIDKSTTWTKLTEDYLVLSNLSYGIHELTIRLKTGFGAPESSYYSRKVTIVVQPLFHQTILFKILFISCSAILLFYVFSISYKLNRKKKIIKTKNQEIIQKNRSLEVKSKQLTELLAEMKEVNLRELDAKEKLQENILVKEKLMSLILHDLRSPLYSQSTILDQIINTKEMTENDRIEMFLQIKKSNDSILKFTRDFLTWYSSQKTGFILCTAPLSVTELIENILLLYKNIAVSKGIQLQYPSKVATIQSDRNILEIILRNIIDNSLKYTEKGIVSIEYLYDPEWFIIKVSDTGPGFSPMMLDLLQSFETSETQYEFQSFGYRFIYTLSQKISARIKLQNNEQGGASVSVLIPY